MDWGAVWLSLKLASCTTLLLCVLGLPLASWLAASRWRWKFVVEAVVALPLVLPPTVLGFYVLLALGPGSPVGRAWESLTGRLLPFSFPGLLVASVLYSLPFAVRPFAVAFAAVDRRLVEASWCLGVSRIGTFFRVVVPLSWTGILTGIILTFAHTLGEFGVVLMVGGNIPGQTRTVSISIYDDVQALNYDAAGRTALFLLVCSFTALALTYALQRRPGVP
jgi:molybdate transport system permease protein